MRIIKCDRCGAEIDQKRGTVGCVAICAQNIRTGDVSDDNPFKGWDLCDSCTREIHEFIKTDPKEKKFERILESVDAGKKKKPYPGSGPTFDVDKAQALRDAGWPLTKIAKEVGVSDVTVSHWTHAPEPKQAKPHEWAEHEPVLGRTDYQETEEKDGKSQ